MCRLRVPVFQTRYIRVKVVCRGDKNMGIVDSDKW